MQKKIIRKNSQSRLDEMVNTLRQEIISGEVAVGRFLPSESDLEKRFRIGNNSVRKGLDKLVREGLIRKIPRVGNMVLEPPPEQRAVVRLGIYNTTERETDLSALLKLFSRRYPHIRVQTVVITAREYSSYIREHMTAGTLDAAMINHHSFREMSAELKEELLEPLERSPDAYPFTEEPFVANGRLLVRPRIFSPLVLCYNRTHLKESNLPEPDNIGSWDALIRLAERLAVEKERFGFSFHLLSRNRWPVFLMQSGISFKPDEDGRYRLPEARLTECLEVCRQLVVRPNVFPAMLSGRDGITVEWFLDGKVSMIMTTYFALNQLKHADISFDIASLPTVRENRTMLMVIGLIVNRKARMKEAARLLVDFLGSCEAQLHIRKHTMSIPAQRQAAEAEPEDVTPSRQRTADSAERAPIRHPSRFRLYRELIPAFRLFEDLPLTNRELAAIQKEAELFWTGLQDGPETCRRMERTLFEVNRRVGPQHMEL